MVVVVLVCRLFSNGERGRNDLHTAKSPPQSEYFVTRFVVLTFGETKAMAMRCPTSLWLHAERMLCRTRRIVGNGLARH